MAEFDSVYYGDCDSCFGSADSVANACAFILLLRSSDVSIVVSIDVDCHFDVERVCVVTVCCYGA